MIGLYFVVFASGFACGFLCRQKEIVYVEEKPVLVEAPRIDTLQGAELPDLRDEEKQEIEEINAHIARSVGL